MNLEPLRRALRTETEGVVERRRAEVTAECERILAEAESGATAVSQQARIAGEEAAGHEAVRRRAVARRRAREIRLAAQRRQLDELRRRSTVAVLELRDEPTYPELLARLAAAARSQLGEDAELDVDPSGRGGVIGRLGRTSVDYTLPTLAERALRDMGAELERLWA